MNNFFSYSVQLPPSVKGVVSPNEDGDYTIYLNSLYNDEQQCEIFNHEMRHILLGHLHDERPLQEMEQEAADPALLASGIQNVALHGIPAPALLTQAQAPATLSACATTTASSAGKRETPAQRRQRVLQFMQEVVYPKYGKLYSWVEQLQQSEQH